MFWKKYWWFLLVLFPAIFLFWDRGVMQPNLSEPSPVVESNEKIISVTINSGDTFSQLAEKAGLSATDAASILDASKDVYDLASIRAGKQLDFYFAKDSGVWLSMIYPINSEEELVVKSADSKVTAERIKINYEIKIKIVSGVINESFYQSALAASIDERAIIDLANIFAWTIDFGMGIRNGDSYKFIYEERYRDGQYVMPGKILGARFNNDGKIYDGYYFSFTPDANQSDEVEDGYYAYDGQSLQKIFLKNPVDFRYISSGFTTGRRYIEAFNISTGHRAIDYAAQSGTPISAVGDGKVTFAGWSRVGYGNMVTIRHNATYSTNYAHMSKILVKSGQQVKQGQTIGKVGSTGLSTGPHLHYELVQNGVKINPLTVELPSDKAIPQDLLDNFHESIKNWQQELEK